MDSQISGPLRVPSSATKVELLRVARDLFTERGYAATPLDSIVTAAHVTKGALYHHFDGKPDLFAAVHRDLETEAVRRVDAVVDAEDDPWAAARAGMHAFLAIAREPDYRRIIVEEGPVVLGLAGARPDERSTFATVARLVRATLAAGEWEMPEELLATLSRIMFGALNAGGASVATSDDQEAEAARVETSLGLLVAALRQLSSDHPSIDSAVDTVTATRA